MRFFLISRKADTEFVFDVDLALAQTDENPVYYIQYAHARICSVLAQARAQDGDDETQLLALASADGPELAALLARSQCHASSRWRRGWRSSRNWSPAPPTNSHRTLSRSISRT